MSKPQNPTIKRRLSSWLVLLAVLLLIPLLTYLWISELAAGNIWDEVACTPPARVGLLLGTSKRLQNGNSNGYFLARMRAAANLYKAHKLQYILVSGDNAQDSYNEPQDMRKQLEAEGVPRQAIILDYAGFRTLDSVVRAYKIFGADSLLIISQRFHVERALFIAHSHGITAYGYAAPDPESAASRLRNFGRELAARVDAVLDCYVLHTQPHFLGERHPI